MCIDDPSYMMEIQSKAPQRSDGGARVRSFCPQIQTRLGSLCLILSHPQEIRQDFLQWLKYEININVLDYFIGDCMERYLECVREVWWVVVGGRVTFVKRFNVDQFLIFALQCDLQTTHPLRLLIFVVP